MSKILILKDHSGYTFTSLKRGMLNSIDNEALKIQLQQKGYEVSVVSLHQINEEQKCAGTFVFYPSSEVSGLFYKEFIGDILLELKLLGLVLLPGYEYFRAHHNKVFMEMLRNNLADKSLKTIQSFAVYDVRDLENTIDKVEKEIGYPMVLKMSSGSGAKGVSLAKSKQELLKKAKKMSFVKYRNYSMSWYSTTTFSKIKTFARKLTKKEYINRTYPQEKMIIQSYVANLRYDYKVLIFGSKYYVLKRLTRDNDFRASGSGKLYFIDKIDDEIVSVLNIAKRLYRGLDTPMLSVDVAYDGENCHIIEFQCTSFGPYTLQFSDKYYIQNENREWLEINTISILEEEVANAIDEYIRRKH